MGRTRVFIIGLDGGSWDVIKPLMHEGLLPNFRKLVDNGAWGILHSTFPPSTCPAWFTFSTGMKPSRIGIYHFQGMHEGSNRLRYSHYGNLEHTEFWDVLMREGMSCGIINHPMFYHRKRHHGYVIPGSIVPETENTTFPGELMEELHAAVGGYELDQTGLYFIDDETLLSGCLEVAHKRTAAMCYLNATYPTDFFLGVYTILDRVSHRFLTRAFLREGAEREAAWNALEESCKEVDRGLGKLLSFLDEDDLLMVISDHGFKAKPWNIHINQFLIDRGYLSMDTGNALEKTGLTQRNLGMILAKLGFKMSWLEKVHRLVPGFVRNLFPTGKTIYGEYMLDELIERGKLDWSRTQAILLGYGIYLNTTDRPRGIVTPAEVEPLKERIRDELQGLCDPDGGRSDLRVVEPTEVYGPGELINPPDLMIVGHGKWEIQNTLSGDGELFTPNERAGHHRDGMFIINHPWVENGEVTRPLEMEDLAPLILHLYGQPVLGSMNGEVRFDLFRQDADIPRKVLRCDAQTDAGLAERQRISQRVARLRETGSL